MIAGGVMFLKNVVVSDWGLLSSLFRIGGGVNIGGIFIVLLGVSGVGPKVAMSLLSTLTVNELRLAVISEDVKAISKANGIGAKGASRIILELKDKLSMEDMLDAAYNDSVAVQNVAGDVRTNVISALTALGYSGVEAGRAVSRVDGSADMDEEQLLKAALRFMI